MDLSGRESDFRKLVDLNQEYLLQGIGLGSDTRMRRALKPLMRPAARRFARLPLEFDEGIAVYGLRTAAHRLLLNYVHEVDVRGAHNVPSTGPVVFVPNHPGAMDSIALYAAIPRLDIRAIAADIPFLRSLRNLSSHHFYVTEGDKKARAESIRFATSHLRTGGALLIFPAGNIEPEPRFEADAAKCLSSWHGSVDFMGRFAPGTQFVPTAIQGALLEFANHPLVKRIAGVKTVKERELVSICCQLLVPWVKAPRIEVEFGKPLEAPPEGGPASLRDALRSSVTQLIAASRESINGSGASHLPTTP